MRLTSIFSIRVQMHAMGFLARGLRPPTEGLGLRVSLSEAQKKMIEMYDSKKKEMKKKDKISDMMTKDSVKKDDEKKEEG